MLFSYNLIQQFIKDTLPEANQLAELLNIRSFEVEEIKELDGDYILDIDVLSNRGADAFSHWGMAREICAIFDLKLKELERIDHKENYDYTVKTIKDVRYTGSIMTNVKISKSPKWIVDYLESLGLQSINNVVDIMNIVMLEVGQPLHAFDLDKLEEQIYVDFAKTEEIECLDDKTYKLDKDILTIRDKSGPIAIAGIKGGKRTGVSEDTENILIEAAKFKYGVIRKASKKLNLKTDASWRFENNLSEELIFYAQKRAIELIKELAGGKFIGMFDSQFGKNIKESKEITLDMDKVNSVLGTDIKTKEAQDILTRLGFRISNNKVIAPFWRQDINIHEDLIEEIGRIHGFENIESIFPKVDISFYTDDKERELITISQDILKELGFSECYNYSFREEGDIKIKNPMSNRLQSLRNNQIDGLEEAFIENQKNYDNISLFEIGTIFTKNEEKKMISAISSDSLLEMKEYLETYLSEIGIKEVQYKVFENNNYYFSAEIIYDNEILGIIGQRWHSSPKSPVCLDLDFNTILKYYSKDKKYKKPSPYPPVIRDISLFVPLDEKVGDVMNIIMESGKINKSLDLFDIYEKEEKSLAFHIKFTSNEKTLTGEEVDSDMQLISKNLEKQNYKVRR